MNSITQQVLAHAAGRAEGITVSAKELLHLGSRASVDQALSRLHRRGKLLRVSRGLYTCPVKTEFGHRAPNVDLVLEDIVERTGEIVVPSGAVAANKLGLTTQNPVRRVLWTSGKSRLISVGAQQISLLRRPAWQLAAPYSPAGEALRALSWLGQATVAKSVPVIRTKLSEGDQRLLVRVVARGPRWMTDAIASMVALG